MGVGRSWWLGADAGGVRGGQGGSTAGEYPKMLTGPIAAECKRNSSMKTLQQRRTQRDEYPHNQSINSQNVTWGY